MKREADDFFKITWEVMKLSDNEILRGWMRHIKLTNSLKLEFLLIGAIQFPEKEFHFDNGITLKPHPTWKKRSHLSFLERPISLDEFFQFYESFNQLYRGEYVFDGWIDVKNGEKETLGNALREVHTTVNVLSFHSGAKLTWEPRQKWFGKGVISTVYSDENIENVNDLIEQIRHMPSGNITEDILRSIDWYRTGLYSPSELNQFLSFWRCIEILIDTWNKTKHPEQYYKKGDRNGERKHKIGKKVIYLRDIAKTAFEILLKNDPDKDRMYLDCFGKGKRSWYKIRNKIAHGRVYEGNIGKKLCDEKTIFNIRKTARKFIMKSILLNSIR